MSQPYFRYIPDLDYVSRIPNAKDITDYIRVKNFFKRAKISEEIFQDLSFFTKYKVLPDERPDNIAFKLYGDQNLDWLVMLANNIIDPVNEWPLTQQDLHDYMISKYDDEESFFNVHHYETVEVKDSSDNVIVKSGLEVPQDYSISFFDIGLGVNVTQTNITKAITNYDFENDLQDKKSNIYALKPSYVTVVINDLEDAMTYQTGSSQYISDNVVKGENIRLYQN